MKKCIFIVFLVFGVLLVNVPAQSDQLTFEYDTVFGDEYSYAPEGAAPWIVVTLLDIYNTATEQNDVIMTINLERLTGEFIDGKFTGEFIDGLGMYFNLDPIPSGLTFTYLETTPYLSTGSEASAINVDKDGNKADGDGYFDIRFQWQTDFFLADEIVYYMITGDDLDVNDFYNFSVPQTSEGDSYLSAAHVQGIDDPEVEGDDNSLSGWIAPDDKGGATPGGVIPEPATLLLIGAGLIGFAGLGKKYFK